MQRNTNYGKLTDGKIAYAPAVLIIDNAAVFAPSAEQYHAAGWKTLHLAYPSDPAPTGYHYEEDGYTETDTDITKKWKTVADPVVADRYSVPDLFFWLRTVYDEAHTESPKGQAVKDWLDTNNLYTIAVTTRVVAADNELFQPTLNAIKTAVGFTDADVAEALAYAKTDAYPDDAQ